MSVIAHTIYRTCWSRAYDVRIEKMGQSLPACDRPFSEEEGANPTQRIDLWDVSVCDGEMSRAICITALALSLGLSPAKAQDGCARDAMLVMDGSASMDEKGFNPRTPTRIDDARDALSRALPEIAPVRRVGLLVYGPGGEEGCSGISLKFKPVPDAAGPILREVGTVMPGGMTPLAASVEGAAAVLGREGIIVLVTDGNETCGGRPCELGADLAEQTELTVHVIGFRVSFDPFAWNSPEAGVFTGVESVAKCLSDATGGMYVNTQTVEELAAALRETLGCLVIGMDTSRGRIAG